MDFRKGDFEVYHQRTVPSTMVNDFEGDYDMWLMELSKNTDVFIFGCSFGRRLID